jgi:WD40 repeat protein
MPSDLESINPDQINTDGGAFVDGTINTSGGDFIGRDKVVITEETAYTVHGLTNPYLGLRAFGYEDRAIYAGREQLAQETIQCLTSLGVQQALLFITGASGSGKSSFAQAGLIPQLESHYTAYQKTVRHAIFRPSSQPMVMLADALLKFHPDLTPATLATNTPKDQINLLLIDQFEELFIQSEASQRAPFCDFLISLPSFAECRIHILITLRVDYLDELFAIQPLWAIAKASVELRTMSAADLRNAIQKPLQVNHPQKRFTPELLDCLVQEASEDAALLPLLQVTLAELWKTGRLVLSNYHNLTNAIRQHADTVYDFRDYDKADPKIKRSTDEQQALMSILLDLINVSVDGDDRRDARQRRTRQELEQGSTQRPRLIEELVNARLLAAANETRNGAEVEVIDIIHESLIDNWDRLCQAIEEQRQQLQRRARFKLWLGEWLRNGRQDGYLLMDMLLAEARVLVEGQDIEVQRLEAQEFYLCSLEYQASVQRAKDKAEAEHKARQQWLRRVAVALVIMVIAAGIALWQWQRAETAKIVAETARNESEQLKAQIRADQIAQNASLSNIDTTLEQYPQRAILFAIESVKAITPPIPSALQSLYTLLARTPGKRLSVHGATDNEVALSSDGRMMASVSTDNTIQIWSLTEPDGEPVILNELNVIGHNMVFAPDGKTLALVSEKTIQIWSLTKPEVKLVALKGYEYKEPQDTILDLAFSPDGKMLASAGWDGMVRLWSLAKPEGDPIVLAGHTNKIPSIAFSPNGKMLASGSLDKTIRVWSLTDLDSEPIVLRGHEDYIASVRFSPDSKMLVSGSNDNTIRLWLLDEPGSASVVLKGHKRTAMDIAFSSDGKTLASASADKTLRLWSLDKSHSDPTVLLGHDDVVYRVTFASDGNSLISASWDNTIRRWPLAELNGQHMVLIGHKDGVSSVTFSPDGKTLATSGSGSLDADIDNQIRLWSLSSLRSEPVILSGHRGGITSMTFSPDSKILASASEYDTIRLWSLANPKSEPQVLLEYDEGVMSIAFSPDSKTLASAGEYGTIRLWSLGALDKLPIELKGHKTTVTSVVFSSDGKMLASASNDETIRLWFLTQPGREPAVLTGHESRVTSVAISPDNKMLASGDIDNTIRLWSLSDLNRKPLLLRGHEGIVTDVVFSPDGKTLASASEDATIRLWSLSQTSNEPIVLKGHKSTVTSVAFSPDSKMLASGSSDNTIRLWYTETADLLALACNVAGRNLREEEWQQYFPNEEYRITCPQWPLGREQ